MKYLINKHVIFFLIILLSFSKSWASTLSQDNFEQTTLKNNMQVFLIKNNKMPVVSHMVWYKIGAIDEEPGKSGIAHFLEHLMFKATSKYQSGDFSKKIAKIGGNDNAFTDNDYTAYFQNIPKESLPLVMELEAERMQNLVFDEKEVLKERAVILEERRFRIDNDPRALLQEQIKRALFLNHPYGRPLIGWYHEMANLSLEDARNWYKNYYNPANAFIIVSGDITMDELKPMAEKYYGKIKKGNQAARKYLNIIEPEHITTQHIELKDNKVKQQEFLRYYIAPSQVYGKKEYTYSLMLLSYVLGSSDASILYQDLVLKNKTALEVGSYYDDLRMGPGVFSIRLVPTNNTELKAVEHNFDTIINSIINNGINEEDLARAKKATIAESIYAKEDLRVLANTYGQAIALGLGAQYVQDWEKNINSVTNEEIKKAAEYVFKPEKSVTGYLLPQSLPQR